MRKLLLALSLVLASCSTYPVTRVGIVHDYVFYNAEKECRNHGGVHYIVSMNTVFAKSTGRDGFGDDYPCTDTFKFRCQDGTLLNFDSEAGYCFIGESQLKDTLDNIDLKGSSEYTP